MWISALFGAKIFEFFEIYGVSTRTRELIQMWIICRQEGKRGVNFLRFCPDGPNRDRNR